MPDEPHAPGYPDYRIGAITHPGGPQRVPKYAYDLSTTIPHDRNFQGNQHFFEKSAYFGGVPQIWLDHLMRGFGRFEFFSSTRETRSFGEVAFPRGLIPPFQGNLSSTSRG